MAKALNITDSNFDEVVLKSDKPVLVDFWATWCGPCLMMAPVVDELANDYADKAVIAKLDVDANPFNAQKYGIRSIPTMLIFKNGKIVDKLVGTSPKTVLKSKLDAQLA